MPMKHGKNRTWHASIEARILVRPFATVAALAGDPGEGPRRLAARVALLLFVIGVGVSMLTAGRLSLHHVVGSMAAWTFAPARSSM